MKHLFILLTFTILGFFQLQAQEDMVKDTADYPYWIEMMQDHDANFYDVQKAFNTYWEGKTPGKSSGWKVFKRWEYDMQFKIDEKGNRLSNDYCYRNVMNFKSQKGVNSTAEWTNIGPIDLPVNIGTGQPNGMGRVNAIAFHPTNENIIFAGAPQGGLWKSTDGGQNWEVLTDDQPTLGVSSIIVSYNDPNTILIGTGDRDAGDADGMGVMKSTDGGNTWNLSNTGIENVTVGRMIQDPNNSNTIIIATDGGIYKSTDLGDSWSYSQGGNFKDVLFKEDNSDVVFTITGNKFYKSTDNGDSFTESSFGLPNGNRGAIATSPDNPNVVYVLLSQSSLFGSLNKSTNAGDTWTTMSTSPNIFDYSCDGSGTNGQGWYDMDVAVDPNNANFVFVGGVNTWVSSNSGVNWTIKSHWYGGCGVDAVHADMHVFEINPLNNRLYNGNDGGLYYTDNNGNSWTQISSGLAISQIYKMGSSATVKDLVINGYQDNGTATYTPTGWKTVMGGDGMDCVIDWEDESYAYGEYYFGSIDRIKNNSSNQGSVVNGIPEEGAWVTPYLLSKSNSNHMFVGMKDIWFSENIKAPSTGSISWTKISDIGSNNCNLLVQSDANHNIMWVGKNSTLRMCEDVYDIMPIWTQMTGIPGSGDIRSLATDPNDENRIFLAKGNNIYYSPDLGDTWENISGSLPDIPMRSIVFYKNSNDGLYVGAQAGIYYKDANMSDWVLYTEGFPLSSQVTELEIYYDAQNPANDRLRASTYGRGLWETPMFQGDVAPDFTADQTTIPAGCTVNYTDLTTGVPTSWSWTFEGGTPATSTEQNPSVVYQNNGSYNVSLEVSNVNGNQELTKEAYINVEEGLLPEIHFSADQQFFCSGEEKIVHLYDESLYCPASWEWSFSPNTVEYLEGTNANSQNPVVKFNGDNFDVTLTATNSNGSMEATEYNFIASGGAPLPFYEDFENGNAEDKGWMIENEDDLITWKSYDIDGNGSNKAMGIDFHNYTNFEARDRLISPIINLDLNYVTESTLHFQHAYSQYYSAYTDSLIVLISTDCGDSWTRLMAKGEDGNGSFATHELTTDNFIPATAEDWCGAGWGSDCYSVDLSDYMGFNSVKIAFESFNMRGNYLYIDNVEVDFSIGIEEKPSENLNSFSISPNPNNGAFALSGFKDMEQAKVEIFDPLGRLVYIEQHLELSSESTMNIALDNLTHGVYLVKISNNNTSYSQKFIIE